MACACWGKMTHYWNNSGIDRYMDPLRLIILVLVYFNVWSGNNRRTIFPQFDASIKDKLGVIRVFQHIVQV